MAAIIWIYSEKARISAACGTGCAALTHKGRSMLSMRYLYRSMVRSDMMASTRRSMTTDQKRASIGVFGETVAGCFLPATNVHRAQTI